jgi:hypothetical protein
LKSSLVEQEASHRVDSLDAGSVDLVSPLITKVCFFRLEKLGGSA